MRLILPLIPALILSACAPTPEQCLRRAERAVAAQERVLAQGYRVTYRTEKSIGWDMDCTAEEAQDALALGPPVCMVEPEQRIELREPINRVAEQARLAELRAAVSRQARSPEQAGCGPHPSAAPAP